MGALFVVYNPDRLDGGGLQFLLLSLRLFGRAFGTVHPVDQAVGHGQQDQGAQYRRQGDATEDGELNPAEERRLRAIKQRLCGQAAAIIELTRRYYTLGGE